MIDGRLAVIMAHLLCDTSDAMCMYRWPAWQCSGRCRTNLWSRYVYSSFMFTWWIWQSNSRNVQNYVVGI